MKILMWLLITASLVLACAPLWGHARTATTVASSAVEDRCNDPAEPMPDTRGTVRKTEISALEQHVAFDASYEGRVYRLRRWKLLAVDKNGAARGARPYGGWSTGDSTKVEGCGSMDPHPFQNRQTGMWRF